MGNCVVKSGKNLEKKRRTASTLAEKSMRQNISEIKEKKANVFRCSDVDEGNSEQMETSQNIGQSDKSIHKQPEDKSLSQNKRSGQRQKSSVKNTSYVSCFHNQICENDPITKIVLLEEACITLKHKMEQEKLKYQQKHLKQISGQSTLTDLNKDYKLPSNKNLSLSNGFNHSNGFFPSHQSTHPSFEQNARQNTPQCANEIHCYSTIIKLADFIQEKSQRLWEDPNDDEIHDALSSLFWASSMLQLDCLQEFKIVVSQHINVIYDDNSSKGSPTKQDKINGNNNNQFSSSKKKNNNVQSQQNFH